jgi:hypothetical protein
VSLITGAAAEGGFKGLAGQFQRQNLLRFAAEIPLELRFSRLDTRRTVDVACDTSTIAAAPEMAGLLRQCLHDPDDAASRQRFGALWQERVRRLLLEHGDDPQVFMLRVTHSA